MVGIGALPLGWIRRRPGRVKRIQSAGGSIETAGVAVNGHDRLELREQAVALARCQIPNLGQVGTGLQGQDSQPDLTAAFAAQDLDARLDRGIIRGLHTCLHWCGAEIIGR